MAGDASQLDILYARIAARRGSDPSVSYTAKLLSDGKPQCARKLGEEAVETMVAALSGTTDELVAESADLLYHWLVLLAASGVEPGAVYEELARRESRSGLEEKAAR